MLVDSEHLCHLVPELAEVVDYDYRRILISLISLRAEGVKKMALFINCQRLNGLRGSKKIGNEVQHQL
jgi:hypothetical protein